MSAHQTPQHAGGNVRRSSSRAGSGRDSSLSRAGQALFLLTLAGAAASFAAMLLDSNWDGALRFAVVIALLLLARSAGVPSSFLGAFSVLLLFATWAGVAHWYRQVTPLDAVVHFFTPGALAAVAYFMVARAGLLPDVRDTRADGLRGWAPAVWVTVLGTTAAVVWEFYEWVMEQWTPSQIHVGYTDTVLDLFVGTSGSLVAGIIVVRWRARYHSRRNRVSGVATGR